MRPEVTHVGPAIADAATAFGGTCLPAEARPVAGGRPKTARRCAGCKLRRRRRSRRPRRRRSSVPSAWAGINRPMERA